MNVKELIEILSEYPSDMEVTITYGKGGFNPVTIVDFMTLVSNYNEGKNLSSFNRGLHEDYDYVELIDEQNIQNYSIQDYIVIK